MFYGEKDSISPPEDVEFTAGQCPSEVMKDNIKVDSEGWTSGDFVTAIHAKKLVYDPLIKIMMEGSGEKASKDDSD